MYMSRVVNSVWGALLLVVVSWSIVLGGMACSGGCSGAGQAVKVKLRNVQGCDVEDAKAIVTASAVIVAAVAEAKAGGDKVAAMLRVIEQMAVINEHWKHCKSTAAQSASVSLLSGFDARASPDAGIDAGIDAATLAELLAGE
jgi:hypothetical protein